MAIRNKTYLRKRIDLILERYSYLLPEGIKIKYYTFIELIEKAFSLNNPIVKQDINFIFENYDLTWEKSGDKVNIKMIK